MDDILAMVVCAVIGAVLVELLFHGRTWFRIVTGR